MILGADWVIPVDGRADRRRRGVEIADGGSSALGQGGPADELFAESVILPGLVNAHTHLEYARMAGFGDGKPFGPWIEEHIRRKAALDHPADSLVQSLEGARISLAGGVTTVADCCYAGTVAEAAIHTGCARSSTSRASATGADLGERMADALDVLPTDALVTAGLSPHAPFTVTLDDYAVMIALARDRGLPIATHLLESERETQHLDEFEHLLGPDTVLIHGVFMTRGTSRWPPSSTCR